MREQEQHYDDRELPTEDDYVDPEREQKAPADPKELGADQQEKLELQEERDDGGDDRTDASVTPLDRLGSFTLLFGRRRRGGREVIHAVVFNRDSCRSS